LQTSEGPARGRRKVLRCSNDETRSFSHRFSRCMASLSSNSPYACRSPCQLGTVCGISSSWVQLGAAGCIVAAGRSSMDGASSNTSNRQRSQQQQQQQQTAGSSSNRQRGRSSSSNRQPDYHWRLPDYSLLLRGQLTLQSRILLFKLEHLTPVKPPQRVSCSQSCSTICVQFT
jgi:hypothetical protein